MSRMTRAASFLFEPQAFKNDHAVRVMDPASIGGYVMLLCELWEQPEPGVVPDDDRLLASLARMAPETWTLARPQIARAFDTTSRPGFWIQKRMVTTHAEQTAWFAAQSEHGRKGGEASAQARSTKPKSKPRGSRKRASSPLVSVMGSVSGSDSKSESEKIPADAGDLPAREDPAPNPALLDGLINGLASKMSAAPTRARAPLMAKVKGHVESLPEPDQRRLYQFAGWLEKTGTRDDECILRVVADAIGRNGSVENLFRYYAPNGPARTTIEGHYRADLQDRESKRWKAEEWAWVRAFKTRQETTA